MNDQFQADEADAHDPPCGPLSRPVRGKHCYHLRTETQDQPAHEPHDDSRHHLAVVENLSEHTGAYSFRSQSEKMFVVWLYDRSEEKDAEAEPADAQGRRFGVRAGVVRGPVIARRGPVYGYGYRRGYRPGVGAAVGLGLLGGAALGAAAAAPYYGYGYADPCLRQQQVVDAWGNVRWAYVRVC